MEPSLALNSEFCLTFMNMQLQKCTNMHDSKRTLQTFWYIMYVEGKRKYTAIARCQQYKDYIKSLKTLHVVWSFELISYFFLFLNAYVWMLCLYVYVPRCVLDNQTSQKRGHITWHEIADDPGQPWVVVNWNNVLWKNNQES